MDINTNVSCRNGPSEFFVSGTLKTWDITDIIHKINVPTLLANGRHDEAQNETMEPFYQEIQDVEWAHFTESSHCPQLEETDKFLDVISAFIAK